MFEHIYAILKSHDTFRALNNSIPNQIIEIGGGFGGACYWSSKLFNTNRYLIVDLPITSVFQAWFLGSVFGTEYLNLYRTKRKFDFNRRINLCPPTAIQNIPIGFADLAINQNSFPEMTSDIVSNYVNYLAKLVTDNGIVYHNNQEVQILVPPLFKDIKEFKRIYRSPSWTRSGYVEEVYLKN